MKDDLWYKDGLHFECLRCGGCCTGFSGTVRVTDEEIRALSQRLNLSEAEFRSSYTRAMGRGVISLIEKENQDCIFFEKEQGCTVYTDRPRQCRTWPFWRSNVYSSERWMRGAERCPGMNRGMLHGADLIQETSEDDGSSGSVS
jgi:Fe-S-cluster containining protein